MHLSQDSRQQLPSLCEAARLLGGKVRGNRVHFPGPNHGPNDRSAWLALGDRTPDGFIVGSFAPRDDWQAIKDHVRDRLGLESGTMPCRQPRRPTSAPVPDPDQDGRIASGLATWRDSVSILGTAAETYLRSRGLNDLAGLDDVLRFHRGLKLDGRRVAGMVALLRGIKDNSACGIHRTFLHDDGCPILDANGDKIRRMLGRAKGAAIKLDAHEDVTLGLHIGEGIETCLAARQLGYRPTWALGSAKAIETFPVLAGIDAITVFAENDQASNTAAEAVCERYELSGCEAWVVEPPQGDLNDFIRRAA